MPTVIEPLSHAVVGLCAMHGADGSSLSMATKRYGRAANSMACAYQMLLFTSKAMQLLALDASTACDFGKVLCKLEHRKDTTSAAGRSPS